jgi:hypothetical protein
VSDLRERTAGHALIERLLAEWERGTIHLSPHREELEVEIEDSAESWYRGAIGERRVGEVLSALPTAWTVIHSVPLGTGSRDIDHVVIGPGGVFTINTKYSPGKNVWARGMGLYAGGHSQQYVRKARDEALEAARRLTAVTGLDVHVTGVIAFVQPGGMNVRAPIGDDQVVVKVVRETALLEALHSRHPLTPEQVARIVAAAALPTTWHAHPDASSPRGDHLAWEFAALQQHVEPGHEGPRTRVTAPRPTTRVAPARVPTPPRRPRTARPTRAPRRGSSRRRQSSLASALAGLLVAAGMFIAVEAWLHAHATPTPAVTIAVTPTP